MSNKNDDDFMVFVNCMCIYFILVVLAVPLGMGLGQLIKYFMEKN